MTEPRTPEEKPRLFNTVFLISLLCVAGIGIWGLFDPEAMTSVFLGFTDYMLTGISWYWLLITTGFVILAGYMAFGPYGSIRLGRDDERPEFATGSWIAMLFAGGMGAGLLFWGAAEPIYHFTSPPGMEGGHACRRARGIGHHQSALGSACLVDLRGLRAGDRLLHVPQKRDVPKSPHRSCRSSGARRAGPWGRSPTSSACWPSSSALPDR